MMLQRAIVIFLLLLPLVLCGQARYDANWVFGENCGIDFSDVSNPIDFQVVCNNDEVPAAISNFDGDLLLFLSQVDNDNANLITPDTNKSIVNGDSINVYLSASNGAAFIPIDSSFNRFLLFHSGRVYGCSGQNCLRLYYTILSRDSQDHGWIVTAKNKLLSNTPIEESLAFVKHSNGKNWWLFCHRERNNHPDSCSSSYVTFEISGDSVLQSFSQSVSGVHCGSLSFGGEVAVSRNGKYLVRAVPTDGKLYIYSIDRCLGYLTYVDEINVGANCYGLALAGDYIFVGEVGANGNISQYNMQATDVNASERVLYSNNTQLLVIGQMESIGNGVYVTFKYFGADSILKRFYQSSLSEIKYANTDSATIDIGSLFIGSDCKTSLGLPSFPNYNLGPEGVYAVTAGKDTTWCTNINTQGVQLGAPPVDNIVYDWQPASSLSNPTVAQPMATPATSTWYVLTAIDTTAGVSCNLHFDSVYVEVRTCTGMDEVTATTYQLYPNPANSIITIQSPEAEQATIQLYNLIGEQVLAASMQDKHTHLDISKLETGLYIYTITNISAQVVSGKLVVD